MVDLGKFTEKVSRNVEPLDGLMGAVESVLLAVVVRLASWGASIPNALMVARSAQSVFGLTWAWALVVAISLELVSHALVELWQSSKNWNETKRQSDPAMNARLALTLVVLFYVLDFAMVGALAFQTYTVTQDAAIFIALAYPLIGVFVSIVTSERAHLFRLKNAVAIERNERKAARTAKTTRQKAAILPTQAATNTARQAEQTAETSGINFGSGNAAGQETRQAAISVLAERPTISGAELGREIGKSERLGRQLKRELLPMLALDGVGVSAASGNFSAESRNNGNGKNGSKSRENGV